MCLILLLHLMFVIITFTSTLGFKKEKFIHNLQKELSKIFLQSATIRLKDSPYPGLSTVCNLAQPLIIFVSSPDYIRNYLMNSSRVSTLSRSGWLMFYSSPKTLEEFFFSISVPFNCKFLVVQSLSDCYTFTEVYRISMNSLLKTSSYGVWKTNGEIIASKLNIYERRNQLEGLTINATTMQDPPFTIVKNVDDNIFLESGYFTQIWNIIEQRINITTKWTRPADNAFGVLENGTWNGMVGMVKDEKVQIAVAPITMSSSRLKAIDYSAPLFLSRRQMFIKKPEYYNSWNEFLHPFSYTIWSTLVIVIIAMMIYMCIIYEITCRFGLEGRRPRGRLPISDIVFLVFRGFCVQGTDRVFHSVSCRIIIYTCYLTAVVILSSYSAALVSSLTSKSIRLPFDDFEGLLHATGFTLRVIRNSADYSFFQDSTDHTIESLYRKHIQPNKLNLPINKMEAMRELCYKEKIVLLATRVHLRYLNKILKCKIISLPRNSIRDWYSFILSKKSWYKGIINYQLQKLQYLGAIRRVYSTGERKKFKPDDEVIWSTVYMEDVFPITLLCVFGATIGLVILCIERTLKPMKNSDENKINTVPHMTKYSSLWRMIRSNMEEIE